MSEQSANAQDAARYGWQSPPQAANAVSVGSVDIRVNKKVCPECGAHVASPAESCPDCGENMVRAPQQIRCMHCHTTASSELVLCPGCGRELRAAPPKLMTVGAPALAALLVIALLISQWGRVSPLAWARTNLVRGVVLVEDISASIEPEMVIVMTPIVPDDTTMYAVGDASPSITTSGEAVDSGQAVALAPAANVAPAVNEGTAEASAEPSEVLAASVVQALPFGVGGPQPEDEAQTAELAPETMPATDGTTADAATVPPEPSATPLPPTPTATATSEPTSAVPTPTTVPTDVPVEAPVAKSAGLAAALATEEPTLTPTPTWTASAGEAGAREETTGDEAAGGDAERNGVQVAALAASDTTSPEPTVTPMPAATSGPTPTATPIVYQVRAGDTLLSIALTYGVEVDALMEANEMSEQDVYVIQPGQMIYVPVPTPEPAVAAASDGVNARVEAPLLLVPPADARVGCATGGTLIWQRVQFVKDSDKYVLHLGFVSGRDDSGQEVVTWVVAQSSPVTVTEWQLDTSLCELAPDEYDHQWRWWVEVVETGDGGSVSVSPPSEVRSFVWE